MAEIKANEVIEADKLSADLQKIIDKMNELLGIMSKNSAAFQKAGNSTKQLTAAEKEAAENKKKQIALEKEQLATLKKQEAARLKAQAILDKEAAKRNEMLKAVTMEVKNLGDLNKKLAAQRKYIQELQFGSDAYNEMAASIADLAKEQDKANSGLRIFTQRVGNYQEAVDTANMSLGEMKQELRALRNMSFANLKPEEITQIRDRMAELTDSIGDFQSQINTASQDRIPALMNGLQGLVSVGQLATGTLSMFGVETERLDKAMMQLIGVSQALSQLQEMQEKQTLKVALATVKDTIAKAANAVAARGQAMATNGATKATRALGQVMAKNPYTIMIAAAVALTAVIVALVVKMREQKDLMEDVRKNADKAAGEIQAEQFAMNNLFEAIKKTNVGSAERAKLVKEMNDTYGEYLPSLLSEKDSLEKIDAAQKAANDSLRANIFMKAKRAELEAVESKLAELYVEQRKTLETISKIQSGEITRIQSATRDNLIEEEGQLGLINKRIAEQENLWNDISKYYDTLIPTAVNMTKEQADALESYNKALALKSENEKKQDETNQKYSQFQQTINNINNDYKIFIALHTQELEQRDALLKKNQAIFDAYKDFYKDGGYTQEEIDRLKQLYNEVVAVELEVTRYNNVLEDQKSVLDEINNLNVKNFDTKLTFSADIPDEESEMLDFVLTVKEEILKTISVGKQLGETFAQTFEKITGLKGVQEIVAGSGQAYNAIFDNLSARFDNEMSKIDQLRQANTSYYENLQSNYDQDSAEYAQLQQAKEEKDKKYQEQLAALETKKAKFDKVKALFEIAINTAVAVTKLLATNPIAAAAVGVAGAAQAATVIAKPLPQYRVGLKDAATDHYGIVGDDPSGKPEAVTYPDGSTALFSKPTVAFLPQHTSVDTAAETARKLKNADYNINMRQLSESNREQVKLLSIIARNTTGGRSRNTAKETMYINKYLK